jgi:hypothetical protein
MKDNQEKKYYWGIGLENETYMQFEESLIVSGAFIQEKIGFEKYSIDYRKCYKPESLAPMLKKAFGLNENYKVSRMMNSHSLEKLDINYQHKTLSPIKPLVDTETGEVSAQPTENPEYLGKSSWNFS